MRDPKKVHQAQQGQREDEDHDEADPEDEEVVETDDEEDEELSSDMDQVCHPADTDEILW